MIDWLRRAGKPRPAAPPERRSLIVAGRELPVAIRTLRTARRMTLRIAPDGSEARITMPPWGRSGEALAFARERSDWLALQLAAVPLRSAPGAGEGERLAAAAPRRHRDPRLTAVGRNPQGHPPRGAQGADGDRQLAPGHDQAATLGRSRGLRLARAAQPVDHSTGSLDTIWSSSGPASTSLTARPRIEMPSRWTASRSPHSR